MKKPLNPVVAKEVNSIVEAMENFFSEVYTAFRTHRITLKYKQITDDLSHSIRHNLVRLHRDIVKQLPDEALSLQYTSIHFSKIFYNLQRWSGLVETKIKENIVFSNVATEEISEIFRRTRDLLHHLGDAVLTGNEVIVAHVEKEADSIGDLIEKISGYNQERLSKGICHPKASIIFTQMLQSTQDILWHYKALLSDEEIYHKDNK